MIRYVESQDIIKKKWDSCVADSVNERIYAYSWYLDIVAPEWNALVLDDYQAVFPIVHNTKMGVRYVYQPFFTQQLGLFTPLLLTEELVDNFLQKLFELFPFIQINLNAHNKIDSSKKYFSNKINHELDLISEHQILKQNYSKNTKRNLKKALKNKLSVIKNLKPELVSLMFKENKGKDLNVYSNSNYQSLNRLIYKGIKKGKIEVWGVYSETNNLCGGAIFAKDQRRLTFLFSATNDEGKEKGAMVYLIDSFIEAHSSSNYTLDFEGSMDPNMARFYKGFGAQIIHYPHIYKNQLPIHISMIWKLKNRIKKLLPF